jgi:membrane carboxypeptidase/penicillin-binding protein PbpC
MGVRARPCFVLLGMAGAALVVFSCIAAMPASAKSPPTPTQKQIQRCVIAVTGEQPLTAQQVAGCKAVVLQTFLPEKCSEGPSGYLIDLMGGYRGIDGKAAHEWAIRAGHRPFRVRSDQTTQVVIDANIC